MQIVHLDERREFSKRQNRALNEVMLLFSVAPAHYRKILFVLKHLRRNVSLATHYIKTQGHLIGADVEIWEFDTVEKHAQRMY